MTLPAERRILVSAGEPSGDLHGAGVVAALRTRKPEVPLEGCGGPRMAGAGLEILTGIDQLSTIGFIEVLRAIPRHVGLLRRLTGLARQGRYGLAVLIDYPGFHLRLGERLRRAGVPVLYYIAPQLWAWRPGRVARLRRAADLVASILPFEADWLSSRGVPCQFVGHPLLDRSWPTMESARATLGLAPGIPVLGIFPGSREGEIQRNWPLCRDVALRLLSEGRAAAAVVAGTAGGYYPEPGPIRICRSQSDVVLAASTAALIKSGTAALEAALVGTPMVVAYRSSWPTYAIARQVMTVDRISLVNLIAGADVVPEFWHLPVSARPVTDALRPLLDPESGASGQQRAGLEIVRSRLGSPGAAARVADLALGLAT